MCGLPRSSYMLMIQMCRRSLRCAIFFFFQRCLWPFFLLIRSRSGFGQVLLFTTEPTPPQSVSNSPVSLLHVFDYTATAEHRGPPPRSPQVSIELMSRKAADKLAKRALTPAFESIKISLGLEAIC